MGEPFMRKPLAGLVAALFLVGVFGSSCALFSGAKSTDATLKTTDEGAGKKEPSSADLYLYVIEAERALFKGDLDGGIAAYEAIVKIQPTDARAHLNLAQLYIKSGDLDAALASAGRAYELDKTDDKAAVLLAGLYAAKGRIEEAIEVYWKLVEDNPDHPAHEEIVILLSNLLVVKQDFDRAKTVLEKMIELKPGSAEGFFALGRIELIQENCEAAKPLLQKAITLKPDHERAHFSLGYCAEKDQDTPKAIEHYEQSLKINPDNSALRAHLVRMHLSEGNPEEANRQNEMLKYLKINEEDIRLNRALILYQQARFPEAISEFDLILSADHDNGGALYYKALCLTRLSRLEEAIDVYGKIPANHRLYVDALIARGSITRQLGKLEEAHSILGKAQELAPDDPHLIRSLALVVADLGRLDEAISMLEEAIEMSPDDHQMVYSLANIHERAGQWKKSIDLMKKVLEKDPENTDALNFIGYTLLEHNHDLKRADKLLKKASELRPKNGFIMDSYGWLLFKRHKFEQALPILIEALRLVPDEPVIAMHVGDCYAALGDKENALKYYQQAMTHYPEKKELNEILDKVKSLEE